LPVELRLWRLNDLRPAGMAGKMAAPLAAGNTPQRPVILGSAGAAFVWRPIRSLTEMSWVDR